MAYKMTNLSDTVRVGINSDGELNIEVWDKPPQENGYCIQEIFIPANAVSELFDYLRYNTW